MGNNKIISSQNIKELKNEIEQLTHILSNHNTINENTHIGIVKGRFVGKQQIDFANDDAVKIFGLTREEFKNETSFGTKFLELFDDDSVRSNIDKMLETDEPIQFKHKIKRNDGIRSWIVGNGNTVVDKNGVKSCIFTFKNIADLSDEDKKQANLKLVTQNITVSIVVCTLDDGYPIIYANESFADLLGYTHEEMGEIIKNGYMNLIAPEDQIYINDEITMQSKGDNNIFLSQYRIIKKDGQKIWIGDAGVIVTREGEENLMQCTIRDITLQKKREEALMISEKRYALLLNNSNITAFDYDIRTKVATIQESDAVEYNLPIHIENAIDTIEKSGAILPISIQATRNLFKKIERGEPMASAVIHAMNSKGKIRIFELYITNLFNDRGQQVIALGTKKDITEKLQLQREKEFSDTLTSNKFFVYEANITKDEIISYDKKWLRDLQIKISEVESYTGFVHRVTSAIVHPEYLEETTNYLSVKFIMAAFERGEQLISLTYRKMIHNLGYRWVKNSINIIKDESSGDINARCYIKDINEEKEKEIGILKEQEFYKKVIATAKITYTVNISKNQLISGHENWGEKFNIEQSDNYEQMVKETSKKTIYPADQNIVKKTFLCQNLLSKYKKGEDRILCNYRVTTETGDFIWMRCIMSLFEHPQTKNLTAYSYIVNIDQKKKEELKLIHKAEHDALSGFLNKDSTEKYIMEFLRKSSARDSNHAFLIIDIDRFKAINDNFGHIFGDVILSQVADKITKLFRARDILGRIGGDEFVVFMKSIKDKKAAIQKAKAICETVVDVFTQNGVDYRISASVGIAYYDEHGKTYQELYQHSDSALYVSKEKGRDQYTVYNKNINNSPTAIKAIDSESQIESKKFASNISEYIFRIMHGAKDKTAAINSVLELISKHYGISRAYIFESSIDGKYISNTFEWCNEGIPSNINNLQNIPQEKFVYHMDNFNLEDIFYLPDISAAPMETQKALKLDDIKSVLQYNIIHEGKSMGVIGFVECRYARKYEDRELTDLQNISNILGMFLSEIRIHEKNITTKNVVVSIVNALDSSTYVCDPQTHEILFINDKAKTLTSTACEGVKCYHAFWNRDTPCTICPMTQLPTGDSKPIELYNDHLNFWMRASASTIDWIDGRKVQLVHIMDISEYKK